MTTVYVERYYPAIALTIALVLALFISPMVTYAQEVERPLMSDTIEDIRNESREFAEFDPESFISDHLDIDLKLSDAPVPTQEDDNEDHEDEGDDTADNEEEGSIGNEQTVVRGGGGELLVLADNEREIDSEGEILGAFTSVDEEGSEDLREIEEILVLLTQLVNETVELANMTR